MIYKKCLLIICLIICLFSITSVCAGDINETAVASEGQMIMEIQDVDLIEVENQSSYAVLSESVGTFTDLANEIANADGELNLTRNYCYYSSDSNFTSGIKINKTIIINGNGYSINANNKARTFFILDNAKNVEIKNIHFSKNCYLMGDAIQWEGNNGSLINCTFNDISPNRVAIRSTDLRGGVIYWEGSDGFVANCSFNNCILKSTINIDAKGYPISGYAYGGAIYWTGSNGVLINNKFHNCSSILVSSHNIASDTKLQYFFRIFCGTYGGAICWYGSNGSLINNFFENCFSESTSKLNNIKKSQVELRQMDYYLAGSYSYGGAIYIPSNSKIINCTFKNCYASSISNSNPSGVTESYDKFISNSYSYGGAVYMQGNGYIANCSFDDCYLKASSYSSSYVPILNSAYGAQSNSNLYGGAVYLNGLNHIENSTFNACSLKAYSNSYAYASDAPYSSISSLYGGAIYSNHDNCILNNCNFTNCNFSNPNLDYYQGGAVYWKSNYGSINNCNFDNCYANEGAGIYINGIDGNLTNCCFNNCSASDISIIFLAKIGEGILANCSFDDEINTFEKHINSISGVNPYFVVILENMDNNISNFGESIVINSYTETNATGNYSVVIDWMRRGTWELGNKYYLENLSAGNHMISVTYLGNNYYRSVSKVFEVTILKATPTISKPIVKNKGNILIHIPFDNLITGEVSLSINEKTFKSNIVNGSADFVLNNIEIGTYECIIYYTGDNNFYPVTTNYNITVPLRDPNLLIFVNDTKYNESVTVNYTINESAKGVISLYANDIFIKNCSVGEKLYLNHLNPGKNIIKLVYSGDDNFDSSVEIIDFEIIGENIDYYTDYELNANSSGLINFIFNDDANGLINLYFYDLNQTFEANIIDGEAFVNLPGIKGGYHEFVLNYSGDNKYYATSIDDWIYVEFINSEININIPEINWNDTIILSPILPKGATGDISILLDNISLANISLGDSFQYKAIKGGKHYLTIEYSGDEYFTYNETTVEFYVNKLNSNFNMESTFDSEKYIAVPITLNDDANGFITVNINNNDYSGDVINGSFNFTVTDLGGGTHNAIINYTGDDKYNDIYIAKEITVNLKNSNLNLNITNILKDQNIIIKPSLTEGATGTVSIYVDDELKRTINVGTSYTLTKPSIGQHKIRLVYSGNTYFDSAEREFSFRVFTTYPIEAVDTQIVYGTDKKFQAKFYDEYGKILANKYVSFIVNGSEYPVKTNSDGIAVLDVDLGIGEYNVTSVSLLDESTTNKLLIFHSVQAESMIIEYGTDTRFRATFLDETASPLKNTRIVFNIDGKDTMVTTDVNGVAVLNTELSMGTHYITSINTMTDENITNKVVVVSDVDSIITVEAANISYVQKAIVKVNIDSTYLNADVTIKITSDNGYEQTFTQKAAKTITKELSNLNASKYYVDVKYEDSDLLVIQKNTTFNVLKINPSVTLSFDGETLTVDVPNATGNVEIKVNGVSVEETLADGKAVTDLFNLKVGENSVEVYYKGDNNYNPLIKTDKYVLWNAVNLDVDFASEIFSGEYVYVNVYNLNEDNENAVLTLLIDGVRVTQDSSLIEGDEEGNYGLIEFDASGLAEGTHTWKITYTDIAKYINVSKSGTFDLVVPPEPDTYRFVLITNKSIVYVPFDKINWNVKRWSVYDEYVAQYYDDAYVNYTSSTFTLNGIEYTIIESSINYPVASLYVSFNPNEYKQHDGIFYKVKDGKIVDAISVGEYENYDGVFYRYVGLGQMTFAGNDEAVTYVLINGECYKVIGTLGSFQSVFNKAVLNTDYKIANGKFYTLDGEIIENFLDESYSGPYTVVNGTFYDIDGNIYTPHSVWSIGHPLINNNGQLDKIVYGNDFNNTYVVSDGQLLSVGDGVVGAPVKIDMTQAISEDEITIPSLDGGSGESVTITLPSDATGTVTLTIDGKDYPFAIVNGKADVSVPNLGDGSYPYTITYSGDTKYSSFTTNGSLTKVTAVDPVIAALNVNVLYTAGSYYLIKVTGSDGKLADGAKIVIKVNGKTFRDLTTVNGIAKFKVTDIPGTYKMTINALGKSLTRTLTVKHLVTLKKVTVKKSAMKLVLTATLAKVNNKYLKNKKITFKFNGKKYTAKTNKKGVAKVTIKSTVLKKLKVGKKVTYQATYLKDTVKKTIKVKK